MKIIIHSLDELLELTALIRGGTRTTRVGEIEHTIKLDASGFDAGELAAGIREALEINDHNGTLQGQYEFEQACNRGQNELPHESNVESLSGPAQTLHLDGSVTTDYDEGELDIDGLPWDARINSGTKTQTGKGVWKRLRGVTDEVYESVRAELIAARRAQELSDLSNEAEPVATETHALPQDEAREEGPGAIEPPPTEPESDPRDGSAVAHEALPASEVDLEALIAASLEAAQDASDSHVDLLNACRDFTSKYGHQAFTALKAAVAPDDAYPGGGKAVQHFTPGERRLMQACIANYPSN